MYTFTLVFSNLKNILTLKVNTLEMANNPSLVSYKSCALYYWFALYRGFPTFIFFYVTLYEH